MQRDTIDGTTDKEIVKKLTDDTPAIMRALRSSGEGAMATRQFIIVSDMVATAIKMDEQAGYQSILLTTTRVFQHPKLRQVLAAKDQIGLSYFYEIAFEFNRLKHDMLVAIERQKKLDIKEAAAQPPPKQPQTTSTTDMILQFLRSLGDITQRGDYKKVLIGKKVNPTAPKYVAEKDYSSFRKTVDADAITWNSALGLPPLAKWTRQRASYEYFYSQDPFVSLNRNKAVSYMLDQDMRLDDILLFTTKEKA
jgi:hypothetical protein